MKLSFFKQISPVVAIILVVYVVHKLLFYGLKKDTSNFYYSIETLYFWFSFFTLVVVSVLLIVKSRSFDNVGMSFLLITSLKLIFCFLLAKPILTVKNPDILAERTTFFTLFIFFLLLETLFTIRLVNKK